jgi:uncharacterized repeat protein (TIGR03803 family)
VKTARYSQLLVLALALASVTFSLGVCAQAQTETTLYNFAGTTDGAEPYSGVIADAAGNLYGTTESGGNLSACADHGCGTVFKLSLNSEGGWEETVLYAFNSTDGETPMGGLVFDAAGNLYGTTSQGGLNHNGLVFKLAPNSDGRWAETVLYPFHGEDGSEPRGTLIFDSAGNLYGTTTFGGAGTCFSGCGLVFKLTPTSSGPWTATLLHKFTGGKDGGNPESGLVFDPAGNLYGTTYFGGYNGEGCESAPCGVAFELSPTTAGPWKETVIHEFKLQSDGGRPADRLILDSAGNVYGTTIQGGTYDAGVAFELSRSSSGVWTETILNAFDTIDGGDPWAGLTFDSAGNLYGVTYNGGTYDGGVVFKLTPGSSGWTESILYNLYSGGGAGGAMLSPVLLNPAGNLFVTASNGGSASGCYGFGCGSVFEIVP